MNAQVLDPCSASRMMWFDKGDQRALFGDIRDEEHVLCDGRVLKDGGEHGRRFAYTDKSLALRSYKQRKSWQMRHAELALERAKAAIGYFGDARIENTVPPDVLVVPCEYIKDMNWSEC
ncbi:hypothetical protein [Pseudomonas sp. bs2935]|uniref:hypothetical protein n=1 Tax=Pseudomonas sp. bs2935 TaxID=1761895 RepID=UPI00087D2178|nr:hypothetical protein [Pseudomonas sp. bs2935]SDS33197.1 hypothetical protein SAMN04490210_2205 [Pseudomonas sp. bs2935]